MLNNPIKFVQYDKLSDDLYFLGFNAILKFNVTLSKKGEDGKRHHFHKEFEYMSEKYNEKLITMKRSFDFFLSIENMKQCDNGVKEFIMIRAQDMYHVKDRLHAASRWFLSKDFEKLYARKNNELIMLGKVEPIEIAYLAMDKYIIIEPIIYSYDDRKDRGVRLYLSSPNNYVDMNVDKFMGLIYLIDSINMYQSAQLLLNYLGRPELGTNMYQFNSIGNAELQNGYIESKNNNRKIPSKNKQKSFFDKMDDL